MNMTQSGQKSGAKAPTLLTLGYRNRSPGQIAEMLAAHRIDLAVDIRYAPMATSNRHYRGRTLLDLLTSAGARRAVHERSLGNRAYRTGGLDVDPVGIDWLAYELQPGTTAIIVCACGSLAECHRLHVADQVRRKVPNLRVIHLGYEE